MQREELTGREGQKVRWLKCKAEGVLGENLHSFLTASGRQATIVLAFPQVILNCPGAQVPLAQNVDCGYLSLASCLLPPASCFFPE